MNATSLCHERGAPVNTKDPSFSGTPLGWALHGWSEEGLRTPNEQYYEVVALLARSGATVDDEWSRAALKKSFAAIPECSGPRGRLNYAVLFKK